MLTEEKLDFWIKNSLNVLVTGDYGVGKTTLVEAGFRRNGMKLFDINSYDPKEKYYLYFSAGTMDPFVDLIGVPREQSKDMPDGTKFTYLDLLRPLPFATDCVVAIFMDELNRASDKVRNAVLEIIQFKSINGKKFNNLKMVWGAINPEDDKHTYDVERLDPAQKDRFHIHTEVAYKPNKEYFINKFGQDNGVAAVEWWNQIPTPELKKICSPRRLDYAVTIRNLGGQLEDVLHPSLNVTKLAGMLKNGLAKEKLVKLLESGLEEEAGNFISNQNVYGEIEPWFVNNKESEQYRAAIFRIMHSEQRIKVLSQRGKDTNFTKPCLEQFYTCPSIAKSIESLLSTTQDAGLRTAIQSNFPMLEDKDIGSTPVEFKPTTNSNAAFTTYVQNALSQKSWIIRDGNPIIKHNEMLDELQKVPNDLTETDAIKVIQLCNGLLKYVSKDFFQSNYKRIFGPFNYALKKAKRNILTPDAFKMERNKIIACDLAKYVYVHGSKA